MRAPNLLLCSLLALAMATSVGTAVLSCANA
jgi:hypothetical protein